MELGSVTGERCQTGFQNQSEKVIRVLAQDAVRLRLCKRERADYLSNTPHIVALVRIERGQHLIRGQSHRSEELNAIDLSLSREKHHTIIKTVGAFLRRQARDVGGANSRGLI